VVVRMLGVRITAVLAAALAIAGLLLLARIPVDGQLLTNGAPRPRTTPPPPGSPRARAPRPRRPARPAPAHHARAPRAARPICP
jgi:hypothetical protein